MEVGKVAQLYPQYKAFLSITDRRQNNSGSLDGLERRTGIDRRQIRIDVKLKEDLEKTKDQTQVFLYFFPMGRKLFTAINDFQGNDFLKFTGDIGRMLNDLPEDVRDTKSALKPSENLDFEYQKPFSFTRGTVISKFKAGKFLQPYDKTLFDSIFIKRLLVKFGMDNYIKKDGKIKIEGNLLAKILGRAFMRIPKLSIGFVGLMESIHVLCSKKNKPKEAVKSVISMTSVISCIGVIGALGAFYGGLVGFMGMAAGYVLGKHISNLANTTIDQKLSPVTSPWIHQ